MKRFFAIFGAFLLLPIFTIVVKAQTFLPSQLTDIFNLFGNDGAGIALFVTGRVQVGLFIALGLIILVSVIYALIAAFKYVQSQGDPGKIEEAQKAIKAIFLGIAAMLIAIVGIVLVFVFFGADQGAAALFQTCISAPNSEGCADCKQFANNVETTPGNPPTYGAPSGAGELCAECETLWVQYSIDGATITQESCLDPSADN